MTLDIHLELAFVSPEGATDEAFETFLEVVLEELEKIGRDDVEMTASLARRTAVLSTFDGGHASADRMLADVRTALHAANCATPGWEDADVRLEADAKISDGELLDA